MKRKCEKILSSTKVPCKNNALKESNFCKTHQKKVKPLEKLELKYVKNDSELNDSELNDSELNDSELNDSELNDSKLNESEPNNRNIHKQVRFLMELSKTMPEQRTQEWLNMRHGMMTASDIAAALLMTDYELNLFETGIMDIPSANRKLGKGCYAYKTIKQYIREKCVPLGEKKVFGGNKFTFHGTKYEEVVQKVYEYKHNDVVNEFGLRPHPSIPFLGASPDGITDSGRMLEIKVPLSRVLNGLPPIQYWMQMQLQMECCDLDVCDFIECKISEYDSEYSYLEDTFIDEEGNKIHGLTSDGLYKGCLLEVKYVDGDNPKSEYIHAPLAVTMKTHQEMTEWTKMKLKEIAEKNNNDNYIEIMLQEGCMSIERLWWRMDTYSEVAIDRDVVWFAKRLFDFEEIWNNILRFRIEGLPENCLPKPKKEKVVDNTPMPKGKSKPSLKKGALGFCIVDDDDDYIDDTLDSIDQNDVNTTSNYSSKREEKPSFKKPLKQKKPQFKKGKMGFCIQNDN